MIRVVTKKPGMVNAPKVEEIKPGIADLQRLVDPRGKGASFECPYIPELAAEGVDLWVNEEGKFDSACTANFMIFDGQDCVMGPVVFTSHDDEGNTTGLSDAQLAFVLKFLRQVPQSIF